MADASPYRVASEPAPEKRAPYWILLGLGTILGSMCIVVSASTLSLMVVCRIPSDVQARAALTLGFAAAAMLSLAIVPKAAPFVWSSVAFAALVSSLFYDAPWSTKTGIVYGCVVPALLTAVGPPLRRPRGLAFGPTTRVAAVLAGWHFTLAIILSLFGIASLLGLAQVGVTLGLRGHAAPVAACAAIGFASVAVIREQRRTNDRPPLLVAARTLWPATWRGAFGLLCVVVITAFTAGPAFFLSHMTGDGSQYRPYVPPPQTCGDK